MSDSQSDKELGAAAEETQDDFAALLQKEFRPKTDRAKDEIAAAVQTLAQQALADATVVSDDVVGTVKSIIARIDQKLSEQVNQILHHESFQQLESAWRGVHYLVNNSETDEQLKIRVMDVSKDDLSKSLRRYEGTAWDQSPLFKKLYEAEFGQLGGEPYGCLVGDYHFNQSAPDVRLLTSISKISAAAHAPFLTGADPSLLQMDSWQELTNPRDLAKITSTPDFAAWNALRESDDSRYLGLAMPRFLGRHPYGAETDPVEEFAFEEETGGGDSSKYGWVNAAYGMAVNINRSFKEYGWCSRIRGVESGGEVVNLPVHTFPSDDGGVDMKCPTEIAISDRREGELNKLGLMPLIHRKNTNTAAFLGAQSLQKPTEYDDPDATANANLSARLPYLFATCRFAHFLKCMVRDKIGSFGSRAGMQRELNDWILQYVDGDPETSSEQTKARKPLAAAEVEVQEIEGNPGQYTSQFYLRPHYQLEGLTVSLRLVSTLPSETAG